MGNQTAQQAPPESARKRFSFWDFYLYQKPMIRVVIATVPLIAASVCLFGWRSLSVLALSILFGTLTEWLFCRKRGEKVTSAVLVTAVLYALTLPPRVPYMVVAVGIIVAVLFGKEVFGGFGRNPFNPALVGRCFIYICFPVQMTAQWLAPYGGWPAGLGHWVKAADALTRATPLVEFRTSHAVAPYANLLLGNRAGSLGETSALLILLGAAYLLIRRTADWRIMLSCVLGGLVMSGVFHYSGSTRVPDPLFTVLAGGFLFGSVFMATDPISAAQTGTGRFIYGFLIGAVTVILRAFSNFIEGMMFSILLMNTFAPIMDHYVQESKKLKKAPGGTEKAAGESEAQR